LRLIAGAVSLIPQQMDDEDAAREAADALATALPGGSTNG
jgi:hypothetical protein